MSSIKWLFYAKGEIDIRVLFSLAFWALILFGGFYLFTKDDSELGEWPIELLESKRPDCKVLDLIKYMSSSQLSESCKKDNWFGIRKSSLRLTNGDIDFKLIRHICVNEGALDPKFNRLVKTDDAHTDEKYDYILCRMKDLNDVSLNDTIDILSFYIRKADNFVD